MPILREDDPRVGCLAVPISAVGGFILFALVAAALGAGATASSMVGLGGMVAAVAVAALVLRRVG